MRSLPAAALALLVSMAPAFAQDDAVYSLGREKSEAFLRGDLAGLWEEMTPELQQAFGSAEGLQTFRDALERDFGKEVEVVKEAIQTPQPGVDVYERTAKWSTANTTLLMQWTIAADQISGFSVQPVPVLAESRFLDYETKATLQLPFEGEWFVVWGGRTLKQNYHAADGAQRFAMDMLIYRDGVTHTGDANTLESYFCWGQPILSPGAGTVVAVTNDLPDNPIGETDTQHPAGNHVVVDFGNGEFGFLAHMRQGSVAVALGDVVTAGQELGRCGNSGNTSEPHLHMHLQTTPDLADGEGLPAQFSDYLANGATVERGEPQGGQFISQP